MMNSRLLSMLAVTIAVLSGVGFISARESSGVPEVRLVWDNNKVACFQYEPVTLTLELWTPGIEVTGVSESKSGALSKGEFSYVSRAETHRSGRVVEKDGKRWFVYPVDSYVVAVDRPGKTQLRDGRYYVDLSLPVIYDDPFWGRMQTREVKRFEVPVQPLEIDVRKLPENDSVQGFSGAIGNFEVSVDVPPGDIYLNEEATAIITVRGEGWLDRNILPEYLSAFGEGTKLKSFSESRQSYIRDNKLVSELQMECTFIPTSLDNAVIGNVSLQYFDPEDAIFRKAESGPVKVKVQSIAGKSPVLDI